MKLISLKLKNFKGIRDFILDTHGGNVNIFGDNAVGKSTLFDSFTWLLFDKDSQNKKDFQIKTLDAEGKVLHGLQHEVEGVLEVKGRKIILRKVFSEKWTKKRGSATAEFTGHTTDYFIDGVPAKKNEYVDCIADIADENIFKLLTSPSYFNEQLHWQDRRKILLQVCGDLTDGEVIASNKALAKLPEILGNRSLDSHRKMIVSKRAEINKELDKLPVRIDEVQRSLPDVEGLDLKKIINTLDINQHFLEGREKEIIRIENGGEIAEKTKQLRELQGELLELKNDLRKETDLKIQEKRKELNEAREHVQSLKHEISDLKQKIGFHNETINKYENDLQELRKKWHAENGKQFEFEQDDTCPTCGQALPAEKLKEAREKALAKFNLEKANEIEKIDSEGKTKKAKLSEVKSEKAILETKIEVAEKDLAEEERGFNSITATINALQTEADSSANNPAIIKKSQEIAKLEEVIAKLKTSTEERVAEIRAEVEKLKEEAEELKASKAKFEQREQGQKRIEELKQQEKELAKEFEKLEGELYLTEEFIRVKVAMLEEKINSRFKYARFKMFETQINGGLSECCETLFNGVPYSSGLNNAAKINVGLDIINTLSEYYGFAAPIFIDNAESVVKLNETNGQVISLTVSKDDKTLRVEVA